MSAARIVLRLALSVVAALTACTASHTERLGTVADWCALNGLRCERAVCSSMGGPWATCAVTAATGARYVLRCRTGAQPFEDGCDFHICTDPYAKED